MLDRNFENRIEDGHKENGHAKDILFQGARAFVAFLVLISFLYISGINHIFFYRQTPASVEQEKLQSQLDARQITVPLSIFILKSDGLSGSGRSPEDARRLIAEADKIWAQADINLEIQDIRAVKLKEKEIKLLPRHPQEFIRTLDDLDKSAVNIFLTKRLEGINGISYGGINGVAVADFTTVYDFRTLAHEMGHILGLPHVPGDRSRLMSQGANGSALSLEEIMTARENADF